MRAESQTVPPKIKTAAPPSLTIFAGVVLGVAMLGAIAVVFFFNPRTHNFYPVCQFHELTGLYCPGCGATRSLYALLHGQFQTALRDNALFVLTLAGLGARGVWIATKKIRRQPVQHFVPVQILWAFLVIAIIFAMLRNLPAFSFLAP